MGLTKSLLLGAVVSACALQAVQAQPPSELLDLAARVHYGYYHGDARAIEAAEAALDRLPDSPDVLYYRDFAALRRVQLGGAARTGLLRLDECARRKIATGLPKPFTAEAWILVAACALLAGDERRREEALALARSRDDDNPRIVLVEAWALERAAQDDRAQSEAWAAKLAAAVEAFDATTPTIDDPDWGHAEALTALAAHALDRGQVRMARDLLERALMLVPEYQTAVDLRVALQSGARGNRTL
jgi:tetratricopeptide (TPR) repeat protein